MGNGHNTLELAGNLTKVNWRETKPWNKLLCSQISSWEIRCVHQEIKMLTDFIDIIFIAIYIGNSLVSTYGYCYVQLTSAQLGS